MIKKAFLALLLLLITGIAITVLFVADKVDAGFNPTYIDKPYEFTERSVMLFESLDFVGDLHCDALMWQRNMNKRHNYGHVDIPRLQEGNVAFQAFTMVTKSPSNLNNHENDANTDRITKLVIGQGKPFYTWFSLFGRAKHQCYKLNKAADNNPYFHLIGSQLEFSNFIIERRKDRKHVAAFLGVEGGHCLEGDIENLGKLYDLGVRMLGPTHFFDNELGGSAHGVDKKGLTEFGKEVIREMDRRKMIIDVSHSSSAIIDDILKISSRPIISSHTGVDGTCDSPRNLSDEELRKIAASDGLVGIGFFELATCGNSLAAIVDAMLHVKKIIGVAYIALGSDFDGTVNTPFDATGYPLLVEEMLQKGFTAGEIRLIFGDNLKRFLLVYLPTK